MMNEPRVNEDLAALPDKVKYLWRLNGEWKARGVLEMEGRMAEVEGTYKAKPAAGGFGVEVRANICVNGLGTYEDVELYGYDPAADKFHFYAVTNEGHAHDHVGDAAPGDEIKFRYEDVQDDKRYIEEVDFLWRSDDEIQLVGEETLDGERMTLMQMVLTRS